MCFSVGVFERLCVCVCVCVCVYVWTYERACVHVIEGVKARRGMM